MGDKEGERVKKPSSKMPPSLKILLCSLLQLIKNEIALADLSSNSWKCCVTQCTQEDQGPRKGLQCSDLAHIPLSTGAWSFCRKVV